MPARRPRVLPRGFYDRDVHAVAPDLLGKILVGPDGAAGRIVEVEAYAGADDPGSHGHRGETPRARVMFGPPGHLYVYLSYGMHWCANVVCGPPGVCAAVLVRALAPVEGIERMRERRPKARRETDLCSGPAKLCQALGLDKGHDGADLVRADRGVLLLDDGTPPPVDLVRTTRIGLSAGADLPWRLFVPGDPNVSRPATVAP